MGFVFQNGDYTLFTELLKAAAESDPTIRKSFAPSPVYSGAKPAAIFPNTNSSSGAQVTPPVSPAKSTAEELERRAKAVANAEGKGITSQKPGHQTQLLDGPIPNPTKAPRKRAPRKKRDPSAPPPKPRKKADPTAPKRKRSRKTAPV
jgi:hypothetical protein